MTRGSRDKQADQGTDGKPVNTTGQTPAPKPAQPRAKKPERKVKGFFGR